MTSFGQRLAATIAARGPLCVGIDPHDSLLQAWGLPSSAEGVRAFGLRVVDATAGRAGIVKPQVAFFERFGASGFAALEDVIRAARAAGLLVIADAKRGDIGSTMGGYAAAWLDDGAPLESDALTVSPYLGAESLREAARRAELHGKGLFVLAATSNPEAHVLQGAAPDATTDEAPTVAARVAREVSGMSGEGDSLGSLGLVIGATIDRASLGLTDAVIGRAPILAPGFGAQGARLADAPRLYGASLRNVLPSLSRSILGAGPHGIAAAVDDTVREVALWPR